MITSARGDTLCGHAKSYGVYMASIQGSVAKFSPGQMTRQRDERAALVSGMEELSNKLIRAGSLSIKPYLPLLLSIKGKPLILDNHYPFDPFFRTKVPKRTLLKTGRQVSKSTSLASQGITQSTTIPHFSTLYLTPLFEQVRRFSQNYVGRFIEQSPVRELFMSSGENNSVLQKTFSNYSQMIFSFAYLDAERTRGISADKLAIDEIQGFDIGFLPIVQETIAASLDWGIEQYSGTPLSLENTLEKLWTESSMAEWVIKCHHGGCGHWNIPALEYDFEAMLGPHHDDISEETPGLVCAKCRKPLRPRPPSQGGFGRWEHRFRDRRWDFAGYHVPQTIMPMHYARPDKWKILLNKQRRRVTFMNEVAGESYDHGSRLVTLSDVKKAACLPWPCELAEAKKAPLGRYLHRIIAVDWGGGGVNRGKSEFELQSYTTYAVCCLKSDLTVDVIFGRRNEEPNDHSGDVDITLQLLREFRASHVAHDYSGAGVVRETLLKDAGLPMTRILPVAYVGPAKFGIVNFKPPTLKHPRPHYTMDKTRALNYLCQFIKSGIVKFFAYDYKSVDDPGLLHDFMRLIEDKKDSGSGRTSYKILRDPSGPDDFAQAVNIGVFMLYALQGQYPNLAQFSDIDMTDDEFDMLNTPPTFLY